MAYDNVRLQCTPRTFRVVPGEPIRLELTVRADSAAPIRLFVPDDPRLKLRALEKLPVRLTRDGCFVCEVGRSAAALMRRHPELPFVWLDLPAGGEGVFLLEAADLPVTDG